MKTYPPVSEQSLVERLRNRAEIRRHITNREREIDRLADLLDEAANRIEYLECLIENFNIHK